MGFGGLAYALAARRTLAESPAPRPGVGYGALVPDPNKIMDLPAGLRYSVVSRMGERMDDGLIVPGQPDGMACFPGPEGLAIIVCNHELESKWAQRGAFGASNELLAKVDRSKLYDDGAGKAPSLGGTTTLAFDTKRQQLVRQWLSLGGTNRNCAGGPTPWNSWLSCEEDDVNEGQDGATKRHGYVFEVPARNDRTLYPATPIKAMGRFMHEALAIDPATGIVYLSEDRTDGLLYRYIPKERENLHAGGRLQALVLRDQASCDTSNHKGVAHGRTIGVGERLSVRWIDLDEIDAPKDDLRTRGFASGAARFARGEGMWWGELNGRGGVYFAATTGGAKGKGQLWKYEPGEHEGRLGDGGEDASPGSLTLFIEPDDGRVLENADNVTVAPWGDLLVCEDSAGEEVDPGNRLLGVTPQGEVYTLARNAISQSEFAGACFSPDGSTLFVNLQGNGLTLAITGEWRG